MMTLLARDVAAEAVELSAFLAEWLRLPDLGSIDRAEAGFDQLARIVEALPPTIADAALMCYLRNRLRSSRLLKEMGDFGAAAYQLREFHRKLSRRI
jgi:hypothetical protein